MNDFVTSLIRTYVPIIVGAVISWLAAHQLHLPSDALTGAVAFLTAVLQGLYYLVIRLLEQKFPQVGWLLGQAKQLNYKEVK